MSIPNAVPVVVEQAFSAEQIRSMSAALDAARPIMDGRERRANSIGFEALWRLNHPRPIMAAMSAFLNSRAYDFAMQQFPGGFCFLLRNCSFRYHDPASAKSHLDLHFDANFLGLGGKAVNVLVPLNDLGDGVPGLTFLGPEVDPLKLYRAWRSKRDALLAARASGPTPVNIFFDREDVQSVFREVGEAAFITPRIKAGGFVAFHQLVAHGTEVVSSVPKARGSIEFRIADPEALPEVYRARKASLAVAKTGADGRHGIEVVLTSELDAPA